MMEWNRPFFSRPARNRITKDGWNFLRIVADSPQDQPRPDPQHVERAISRIVVLLNVHGINPADDARQQQLHMHAERLLQLLQMATDDLAASYEALQGRRRPVVSVGQFRRLSTLRRYLTGLTRTLEGAGDAD